jgi:glutathione S-transferase
MKLTLYYSPLSCALGPFVTLTEAGADFEVHNVNMRKGDNRSPEFLRLNPKHKVPVLVIDGEPLTENIAIQVWINRQFPKARVLPADSREEIKAISLMSFFGSGIHPRLTPHARPQNYCDLPDSEESVKRVATKLLFEDLKIVDDLLAGREWFFSHFTACDAYFFWCFKRAISFQLDVSQFANCVAHHRRMQERSSVQKVLAHEKKTQEEFARAA